jgi:hypothetical protein
MQCSDKAHLDERCSLELRNRLVFKQTDLYGIQLELKFRTDCSDTVLWLSVTNAAIKS